MYPIPAQSLGVVHGWSAALSCSRLAVVNPCRQYLYSLCSSLRLHGVTTARSLKFPIALAAIGLLVDSEIVLSTRYGKDINKTLSTETSYQQDLINRDLLSTRLIVGKIGSGMWCGKFNSTSNVLVCETQRKVNMYGCVSE